MLSRFNRRLESWDFEFLPEEANIAVLANLEVKLPPTVSGQTQDTHPLTEGIQPTTRLGQSESETVATDKRCNEKI